MSKNTAFLITKKYKYITQMFDFQISIQGV